MLSENARQIAQSQELVSEQLHLTREVLSEMTEVQNQLTNLAKQQVEDQATQKPTAGPTLSVVRHDQTATTRLNHIYRFVTKPVDNTEAA